MTRLLALWIAAPFLLGACRSESKTSRPQDIGPERSPGTAAPLSQHERNSLACETRIRETLAVPGLPGAPGFEQQRAAILAKAKAEPVFLADTPVYDDERAPTPAIKVFRAQLNATNYPWDVLKGLLPNFQARPENGRRVLLRQGYLYAENPDLAYALVSLVGAELLFDGKPIWIQRGSLLLHAQLQRGKYTFTDGPNQGEPVRLLLLDRVGQGPVPEQTLTRDLRGLQYRLHFSRAAVRHITPDYLVADLDYGGANVTSLLRAHGAALELACEVTQNAAPNGEALVPYLERWRAEAARRMRVVQALRESMLAAIDEQLPFDEPRREWGFQLDGKLRKNFLHAYFAGRPSYAYNGDRYLVFDRKGRPLVPEVCVDFLTDTFERTSGTWWRPRGRPPGRVVGRLDYNPLMDINERDKLRRVPGFLAHARSNPDKFEVTDVPDGEKIQLGNREAFVGHLLEQRDAYRPGDILIIRGPTPWDPAKSHYHSFFIYDSDPVTGLPIALVGNAGRPSVRTWEIEARRTPERTLWHHLHPTTTWLESIVSDRTPSVDPYPMSPRGNAG